MAESTLSLGYSDLMNAVSYFLFGKTSYTDLGTADNSLCDTIVQEGYRQFLYPPAVEGIPDYEWIFLRPVTTISTAADDADQDLPDDFGRLINGFSYAPGTHVADIKSDVGEHEIRQMRSHMDNSGKPVFAAIRIKPIGDGTTGQRREVMWYPKPDAVYVLSYKYEAFVGRLTASAPYPVGGMKYGEALKASCLAVADLKVNDMRGEMWQDYVRQIIAAMTRDKRDGAKQFGDVGPKGQYDSHRGGYAYNAPYTLTVGGTQMYPS